MTAIEWLEERFLQTESNLYEEDFIQAKEMELEKLQEAYERGFNDAKQSSNEFGSIFKDY